MMLRSMFMVVALCSLASVAFSHGFVTDPRCRGALKTQRNVKPQIIDDSAPIDYCPHCQNAGGTKAVGSAGPWRPYEPMKGNDRGGFGICGDPVGNNDHMKTGQFANPPSMPFVKNYESGGVANFEFDATTNVSSYFFDVWLFDS